MSLAVFAQTNYTSAGSGKIEIQGTSNIHDWTMTSQKSNCTFTATLDASGNLTALSNVNFSVPVNSLKSTKGSTMDNNAYKAMAAEQYPTIKFSGGSASLKSNGGGIYTVTVPGKLTISSVTKDISLVGTCKVNADKTMTVSGTYKLVTTDYNIKAISIMLGTIKTSANVTIVYNLNMKQ
jgi:polyisoprenoid-binding protein YceI